MINKLLVVYNTSEDRKKGNNLPWYIASIQSILGQEFDGFRLVYSGFRNTEHTKKKIRNTFGDRISYSFVDERLPVNITFNLAVRKAVEAFGDFEGYVYIDSGVSLAGQPHVISTMYNAFKGGRYAMVSTNTTEDNGYSFWNLNIGNSRCILPVGKTVNLHCNLFDAEIRRAFDDVMPTVFASYCTESVFGALCYSINKHFLVLGDVVVRHLHGLDYGSSAFDDERKDILYKEGVSWSHLFRSPKTIYEIINNPEAKACGFFYEEVQNVLMHNPDCYTEEGLCKDPERLRRFVKENCYLKKDRLDYDEIECEFTQ